MLTTFLHVIKETKLFALMTYKYDIKKYIIYFKMINKYYDIYLHLFHIYNNFKCDVILFISTFGPGPIPITVTVPDCN